MVAVKRHSSDIMIQNQIFISDTGKVQFGRFTVQHKAVMGSIGGCHVLATNRKTEVMAGANAVLYRYLCNNFKLTLHR